MALVVSMGLFGCAGFFFLPATLPFGGGFLFSFLSPSGGGSVEVRLILVFFLPPVESLLG